MKSTEEQIAFHRDKLKALRKELQRQRARERYQKNNFRTPKRSRLADLAHLIGVLTDAEVAQQAGCSRERVRQVRVALGLKRVNSDRVPKIAQMAAEKGARAAQEHFGVSRAHVLACCRQQGVKNSPIDTHWGALVERHRDILGVKPDSECAAVIGVRPYQVFLMRKKAGIPAQKAKMGNNGKRVQWTDAMLAELGTVTDVEFAKKHGISCGATWKKRRDLGIPAFGTAGLPAFVAPKREEEKP